MTGTPRFFLIFACMSAALSIGASAMAAHARALSPADMQALAWALDLQRFHALALLAVVLLDRQGLTRPWAIVTGAMFVVGTLFFCIQIELRLLWEIEGLRALVPYGGMAFMAGWMTLAIGAWRVPRPLQT